MKCFYHPEKDAVGICFACSKGVCKQCAIETHNGLACNDTCENHYPASISKLDRLCQKLATSFTITALIYLLAGMILIIAGASIRTYTGIYFFVPMGIAYLVSSWLQYNSAKNFTEN